MMLSKQLPVHNDPTWTMPAAAAALDSDEDERGMTPGCPRLLRPLRPPQTAASTTQCPAWDPLRSGSGSPPRSAQVAGWVWEHRGAAPLESS